jgi:hypothetical protein
MRAVIRGDLRAAPGTPPLRPLEHREPGDKPGRQGDHRRDHRREQDSHGAYLPTSLLTAGLRRFGMDNRA